MKGHPKLFSLYTQLSPVFYYNSNKDLRKKHNLSEVYIVGSILTCYPTLSHTLELERMVKPFEKTILVGYRYIHFNAVIIHCWITTSAENWTL